MSKGWTVNVCSGNVNTQEDWTRSIPTSRDMGSDIMVHRPSTIEFSPPAITNQWAMVQASRDITAYDDFAVHPARCGEGKYTELFFGFSKDDFHSCAMLDLPISYQWFPHAIQRQVQINGLEISSYLSLSTTSDVLQMKISITNKTDKPIIFDLFIKTLLGLNCSASRVEYDEQENAFLCYDLTGANAFAIQSVDQKPKGHGSYIDWEAWYHNAFYRQYNGWKDSSVASYGTFYYKPDLRPGEKWEVAFLHAMGDNEKTVRKEHRNVREHFEKELRIAEQNWNEEIRCAFTPGNQRFSGHLPTLRTSDPHLKRLYDMSCMSLLLLKRTRRMGHPPKAYATGMPGWTHCFLWDTQMTALPIALLDPATLRNMIEFWIRNDPSTFFATDYVTDEPEGVWYAINDFAMCFMMHAYLSVTGNEEWLHETIEGDTVSDHFLKFATRFMERMDQDFLVNYGESRNLLECVFSYAHKVPAFNATNVWMLRRAAELLEKKGQRDKAEQLRQTAKQISASVLELYENGKGYWNCKYPNDEKVSVRTCLDFNYLFLAMYEDLPDHIKEEMIHFYKRELMTETWMHALSPLDPDTKNSVRTDHQDDGAFVSWPAFGILGLLRTGHVADALRWIGVGRDKGLATVTRQGPWGQAYFHGGTSSLLEFGAAMKAPKEYPFIERYAELSGAMYISVIIEELFGLRVDWQGLSVTERTETNRKTPQTEWRSRLDASLFNLQIQNRIYHADLKVDSLA